jgi:hypothetical protein
MIFHDFKLSLKYIVHTNQFMHGQRGDYNIENTSLFSGTTSAFKYTCYNPCNLIRYLSFLFKSIHILTVMSGRLVSGVNVAAADYCGVSLIPVRLRTSLYVRLLEHATYMSDVDRSFLPVIG